MGLESSHKIPTNLVSIVGIYVGTYALGSPKYQQMRRKAPSHEPRRTHDEAYRAGS